MLVRPAGRTSFRGPSRPQENPITGASWQAKNIGATRVVYGVMPRTQKLPNPSAAIGSPLGNYAVSSGSPLVWGLAVKETRHTGNEEKRPYDQTVNRRPAEGK